MTWQRCEPRLQDTLADPVVQAVMKADGVDPQGLEAFLVAMAGKLKPTAQGYVARIQDSGCAALATPPR